VYVTFPLLLQHDPANGVENVLTNLVDECLCLHAEENALLEAGRERIGEDSVIYCNTYVSFLIRLTIEDKTVPHIEVGAELNMC
jgi:hypothetical protein